MRPDTKPPQSETAVAAATDAAAPVAFDPNQTTSYQAKMPAAPRWMSSMMAGTSREKTRLRAEVEKIRGAVPLLMKQRNGDRWTPQDKAELRKILRSASSVSPYLFVWVLPGSLLILPLLAWHLDTRRKRRGDLTKG